MLKDRCNMLPSDHSLVMRQAVIQVLRESPHLSAVIPSDRIYGEETPSDPVWPFIRYGLSDATPYESSCGAGSEHNITIHTFARGPGTDSVSVINALVLDALQGANFPIEPLKLNSFDWLGTRVLRDTPEASNYHGVLRFSAQTLET